MKQHSVHFKEGIRLTSDDSGLLIEVTEYHAKPLKLSWEQVREFADRAGVGATTSGAPSKDTRL